jgi:hypothetical protein
MGPVPRLRLSIHSRSASTSVDPFPSGCTTRSPKYQPRQRGSVQLISPTGVADHLRLRNSGVPVALVMRKNKCLGQPKICLRAAEFGSVDHGICDAVVQW